MKQNRYKLCPNAEWTDFTFKTGKDKRIQYLILELGACPLVDDEYIAIQIPYNQSYYNSINVQGALAAGAVQYQSRIKEYVGDEEIYTESVDFTVQVYNGSGDPMNINLIIIYN